MINSTAMVATGTVIFGGVPTMFFQPAPVAGEVRPVCANLLDTAADMVNQNNGAWTDDVRALYRVCEVEGYTMFTDGWNHIPCYRVDHASMRLVKLSDRERVGILNKSKGRKTFWGVCR